METMCQMPLLLLWMVFFETYIRSVNSSEEAYWEKKEHLSTLKSMICCKYSLLTETQFSQVNNVLDAPASNTDRLLQRHACVSTTQLRRPACNKRSHSHIGKYDLQEVFLQELSQFSQGNNGLDAAACNRFGFFTKSMCFFTSAELANLDQTELMYTMKQHSCRMSFYSKQTKFSEDINVLDVPASNMDGILSRDTCVSSTQLKRPICNKMSLSLP